MAHVRGRRDSALGLLQMQGRSSEITQVASILQHLKDLTCYIYFADSFFDLLLFLFFFNEVLKKYLSIKSGN